MTPAIILHQTQELLLINEQKRILKELNDTHIDFYPVFPLWCFIKSDLPLVSSAKELKRLIGKVEINSPAVNKEKNLVFPVGIEFKDRRTVEEYIIFAVSAHKSAEEKIMPAAAKLSSADIKYPILCRVFRTADIKINGASFEVFNSAWVKPDRLL